MFWLEQTPTMRNTICSTRGQSTGSGTSQVITEPIEGLPLRAFSASPQNR